jgi:hypothetical protein
MMKAYVALAVLFCAAGKYHIFKVNTISLYGEA